MSDMPKTDHTPEDVPIKTHKHASLPGFSFVWLVPLLALAIALGVAWHNYAQQGPLITVTFENASGIEPGETELHYRDLTVGRVEKVSFTNDLSKVDVAIRLEKDVAHFVDEDSQFWVVRPKVTTQGVSGLETVLSGVYIAGAWDGEAGKAQSHFQGRETPPLLEVGQEGTTFGLHSNISIPGADTPILYRGVAVGRIGPSEITEDGLGVEAEAVILAPYAHLVTASTRFWNASGFSFSIDSGGAQLDFTSLASLIAGGITFETMASGGEPLSEGMLFDLYDDGDAARENFLLEGNGQSLDFLIVFDDNIPGLTPGAEVRLGGLRLGEVLSLSGVVDEDYFGDDKVRLIATVRLNPARIGMLTGDTGTDFLDFLEKRVAEGVRARLTNASLLTGGLRIELVQVPGAPDAVLDRDVEPYPQIPSAPANIANVGATAQGLIQRVDALPVEELLDSVIAFLDDSRRLIGSEDMQAAPEELRATLSALRNVAESDEVAALPAQIGALSEGLKAASDRLNTLLAEAEEQQLVASVSNLLDSLNKTAETFPGLSEQAQNILSDAESVSLDTMAARATELLEAADKLIDQDSAREIPAELNASLAELRGLMAELRGGGLVTNANATLASAREAADALSKASESLPALMQRINGVAAQAGTTLGAYDANSAFGRDMSAAIRQIQDAASAIDKLARQISRNPNSLLTGR